MLINAVVSMIGAGFDACIQSTGKVKKNEVYSSIIYLSLLPIIFIMYKLGMPPYMNVILLLILTFGIKVMQVFIMRELTTFSIKTYLTRTFWPCALVILISSLPLFFIRHFWGHSIVETLIFLIIAVVWTVACVALWGITKEERKRILSFISNKIRK